MPAYRMPAEWEPHDSVWVSWPHREESWPDRFGPVPAAFARMLAVLAEHETVHINVGAEFSLQSQAEHFLQTADARRERIHFHAIPTDDAWCRDHGPIIVYEGDSLRRTALNWQYNAWGSKYAPYDEDDLVAGRVANVLGMPVVSPGMVLEGGSIDVNGAGTLLTTQQCLLNQNRNPNMTQTEISDRLKTYLGAINIIWLGQGIDGDDTDGHVDDVARFVSADTIVIAACEDPADSDYEPLRDNLRRLQLAKDQNDQPLNVVPLPTPGVIVIDGERVPAGYVNFYMGNGLVLVPTFNRPSDAVALDTLARLCPDRVVKGIDCLDLIWGLGAVHCLTQQIPAA